MNRSLFSATALSVILTLVSCGSKEAEKKDGEIPEVKAEQIDSLLNNAGNMIKNANDSLQKDSSQHK